MQTAEQILDAMKHLSQSELKQMKERLEIMLDEKWEPPVKRGDRIRALAGAAHVGRVLDPLPSRESIYGEASE